MSQREFLTVSSHKPVKLVKDRPPSASCINLQSKPLDSDHRGIEEQFVCIEFAGQALILAPGLIQTD